jgi:hypothetical protein
VLSNFKLASTLDVSEEEVNSLLGSHCGLGVLDKSRISNVLITQLAYYQKHRVFNSFSVTDVIQQLENVSPKNGAIKAEGSFNHLPLKGFMKAHFFDARFVLRNLINQSELASKKSKKFSNICSKVMQDEELNPSHHGWQGRLAHEITVVALEERASQNNITGEWIIFAKHNELNYYLCIAKHSATKEEDQLIFSFLASYCIKEYPFLFH